MGFFRRNSIILKRLYLAIFSMIVLTGCAFSEEELLEQMVPHVAYEEDCHNIYIVFENEEIALDGTFNAELSEISKRKIPSRPLHTWDRGEWNYTKVFNITEYPTFLVVDNEKLVLQTTNFQEVDTFLSNQTTECRFHEKN